MGSDVPAPVVDPMEATENRHCPGKTKGKVPKRIHKAEREKMKREQLNELFDELADALDLTEPNNGKASVLCEAARVLKDLSGQIETLRKENASLLSESNYVTIEKNELEEETSALETQIKELQGELEARVSISKPNLNEPPPESQPQILASCFLGDPIALSAANATMHQPAPAVFVVPIRSDPPSHLMTASNVSKPHARYPTPADSWPSQLLGEPIRSSNGVHSNCK